MSGNPSLDRRGLLKAAALSAPFIGRLGAAARRPNILVIMTDQQFAETMSCRIGRRYLHTPVMDGIAAEGAFFSRAYCPNPLCVPARTSLFSGRYPVETGYQTNDLPPIDHQRFPDMGTIFRRAGYTTAFAGKWHMPWKERQPGTHGFDLLTRRWRDPGTAAAAAGFLRGNPGRPFLLVASFINPHNICEWARGDALPDGDVGAPPPVDQCPPLRPNHAPQKNEPDGLTLMRKSYQAAPMFPVGNFDGKKWRQYIWAYHRMTEKVDALIGEVLRPLRESGRDADTLVVFLSDHGDCQGSHRWNQKTVFIDESARVPFILSWKGVTRPGVPDRLVHTGVDLIPTLCDYAGIPKPEGLPGLSLKDTAAGTRAADPREFVVVSNKMGQGAAVGGGVPAGAGRPLPPRRRKY